MKKFVIVGLIFSLTIGGFFGILTIGGFPEKTEWKKKIIAFIISCIIGFSLAGLTSWLALPTT